MTQKFAMGSPLCRQEQELKRQGVPLSRQTMSNWLLYAAKHILTPVYKQMHQELLTREVLHADETTLQVLHEQRLKLSNNRAERSIKPFVIDRKNFLFANASSGAKSSGVIFSLIHTAI